MRKRTGEGSSQSSQTEEESAFQRDNPVPTREQMEKLRGLVGRRLANFGILSNLGLGAGTEAARVFNRDMRTRIWRDIVLEQNWTAELAQKVAAGSVGGDGDWRGIAEVADLLATDDFLWKRWWKQDFSHFEIDIGDELPDWIFGSKKTVVFQHHQQSVPTTQGLDVEKVYGGVPWRRYYAWCQYFQRRCAKLILKLAAVRAEAYVQNFTIPDDVPVGVYYHTPEEPAEWEIVEDAPNLAQMRYENTTFDEQGVETPSGNELQRTLSLSEIALNFESTTPTDGWHGSPLLAWVMLEAGEGIGGVDPEEVPRIVEEYIPLQQKYTTEGGSESASRRQRKRVTRAYKFNFDPELSNDVVVAFMAWYVHMFNTRLEAEEIPEPVDSDGNHYLQPRPDPIRIARHLKYEDGFFQWPALEELPLIPVRDGLRFIGEEVAVQGSEEEEVDFPRKCIVCANEACMRERLFPTLTFCGVECRDKFELSLQATRETK